MDSLLTLGPSIALGLSEALQPAKLMYCFLGVFLGMFVGVIPGIGPLAAMSMLFPVTFYLDPTSALIMLAGIYYGTAYGGSTAAILLNVPGTPSGAVASLDGYPMSQAGRGGIALFLTTIASFIAGSIGILLMMVFSPLIVEFARNFSSAEFFALMLLGLVGASTISSGSALKGLSMIVLGVLFGVVGLDMYSGSERFTFGNLGLTDGISLVVVAMGLFGLTEIIVSARTAQVGTVQKVTMRSMLPTRDDWRRSLMPTLRGSAIGSFFGALPGTGALISSFMAYAVERRISRDPSRFGKGAVEGICAPEAANNAADQTAFIPTMTLGIPGSATMAIMLGVLMIHGISPGPQLMTERPEMFWGLVMSFWIGNFILVLLNIPLIGLWVRLLQIPYALLYPAVLMFVCIGVYSVHYSAFDVWLVIGFGLLGYSLRLLDLPAAPLILGFVLGPLLEEHFRRTMIVSRGDATAMFTRPVSGTILVITLAILAWGLFSAWRSARRAATSPSAS